MADIKEIDKNFCPVNLNDDDCPVFYSVTESPFAIYGLCGDERFKRLPASDRWAVGLQDLRNHTAGGRIRFKTSSPYVSVHVEVPRVTHLAHMPYTGVLGCDLYEYENGVYSYVGTFIPPHDAISAGDAPTHYDATIRFKTAKMRDLTINLPLYNAVDSVHIAVDKHSELLPGDKYLHQKPVVFYGSSITQGGCASRPGTSYEAILSRRYDCDYINLGFSGSALAEPEIAEYISGLDMSVFVYDYDYNAPDAEHLENTHRSLFETVRKSHPDVPVIMASRPHTYLDEDEKRRRDIIINTYNLAVQNGDKNVYFVDGTTMFSGRGGDELCTVDGCHPNDLGFYNMAMAFADIMDTLRF